MKKVLLGTSAIALCGAFASSASAAEWSMRVGGYFESYAAYASSDIENAGDVDYDGVDSKQDAEIHFLPSITLDNGIRFGADIQLEGNTSGDTIDESFIFITGSFGRFEAGNENSAGYKMHYGAPDVTFVNVNSGSLTAFIPFSGTAGGLRTGSDVFRGTLGSTYLENGRNNDAARFTYYTPRFAGFQAGVSYARDGSDDDNSQQDINGRALANITDFGVNYVNKFGDFDIAASARYGVAFGDGDSNPSVFGFGLNLGFAGVTVGGSWAEQNNSEGNNGLDRQDGTAWDVGISYETGPWGVSFTYFNGENVNNEAAGRLGANGLAVANDEQLQQFLLGATYKLAKGVTLLAFGAYVDFEEETGDALGGGDDVDGFVIGTGIKFVF